jgi:hypothetical protein
LFGRQPARCARTENGSSRFSQCQR